MKNLKCFEPYSQATSLVNNSIGESVSIGEWKNYDFFFFIRDASSVLCDVWWCGVDAWCLFVLSAWPGPTWGRWARLRRGRTRRRGSGKPRR